MYEVPWTEEELREAKETDQASAALVIDLKQRGLLDDTLVIWGGEFGRTNYSQGKLTKSKHGTRCQDSPWHCRDIQHLVSEDMQHSL